MPLLPAFILMARILVDQGAATVRVEVPILHVRPSRISSALSAVQDASKGPKAVLLPNDEASTLTLVGTKADVEETRTRIGLFDNAPRRLRLGLRVESPIAHAEWKAQIDAGNNVPWSGADEATGVHLRVVPRLNDDHTCMMFVKAESPDTAAVTTVFRLKLGEAQTFMLSPVRPRPVGEKTDWAPKFRVEFLGG